LLCPRAAHHHTCDARTRGGPPSAVDDLRRLLLSLAGTSAIIADMPSPDMLSLRQINRATLARQMLLAREKTTPVKAIERLVGMQAQWPKPPFLGLWTRLDGFKRDDLTTLLHKRAVVRATFLRATIHVVTAKDFLTLRPAIQPVLEAAMQAILKERLEGIDLPALTRQVRKMLEREPLTFGAIREEFLRADPKADERAMGYAVRMLLPLVQVPVEGQAWAFPSQACFAPAEQWLDKPIPAKAVQPDGLLLRYLEGYGPASADDMRAWSGLPRQAVKDAVERLRPKLRVFRDDGGSGKRELFDLPDAPRPDGDVTAPVRLIPEYDNVITTRADERFVAKADRPRVFLSALRIAATVLVDGFVAGTWKVEATKKAATVTIEPFKALAVRVKKDVEAEAEAVLMFAEPEARVREVRFVKS
jgi:Winged helix DNA-binding domain